MLIVVSRTIRESGASSRILDTARLAPEVLRDLEPAIRTLTAEAEDHGAGEPVAVMTVFDGTRRWQITSTKPGGLDHEELAAWIWQLAGEHWVTACGALSVLSDLIVACLPDRTPRSFVHCLAEQAAGIRGGVLGIGDLIRGGSNHLPGAGLLSHYDDGTSGQVRHFCGIAASTERLGARLTVLLSERLRGDFPGTADDRLTKKAVEFTCLLLEGTLPLDEAGAWISKNLCSAGLLVDRR